MKKETKIIALVLLALTLFFLWKLIIHPAELIYSDASDIVFYHYTMQKMKYDAAQQGNLLLWNPLYTIGISYVNDPESFLFYPLFAPFYLIPPEYVFSLVIMLHIFLAGFFTYLFCREIGMEKFGALVAGIAFMFAPKMMTAIYAGHFVFLAIAYTPLLLYVVERFVKQEKKLYLAFISLVLGLQLLSLHPQLVLYSSFIVGIYFVARMLQEKKGWPKFWKNFLSMALTVVLAVSLAAAYLFPVAEGVFYSSRRSVSFSFASSYSMPFQHLATVFMPHLYGTPVSHTYWGAENFWELTVFVGIMTLLLAIVGVRQKNRYSWFFFGVALFALLFSLGRYTPLFYLFYKLVPGFGLFRAPSRMLFLFSFAAAILAGFGADRLFERVPKKAVALAVAVSLLLITASAAIALSKNYFTAYGQDLVQQRYDKGLLPKEGLFSRPLTYYKENVTVVFQQILKDIVMLAVLLPLLSLALFAAFSGRKKTAKAVVIGLILLELGVFAMPLIDTKPASEVFSKDAIIEQLLEDKSLFRVFDLSRTYPFYKVQAHGIDVVETGSNINIDGYADFLQDTTPAMISLLNVKYRILENSSLVIDPDWLPRAFVVRNAKVVSPGQALAEVRSSAFDPRAEVILESSPASPSLPIPLSNSGNFEAAAIASDKPEKIMVAVSLSSPGFLVLSELYYPGWKAFDNGKEIPILKTNVIFRAVALAEGSHVVSFRYEPVALRYGLIISGVAAVILIIFFIRRAWPRAAGR